MYNIAELQEWSHVSSSGSMSLLGSTVPTNLVGHPGLLVRISVEI